MVGESTAVCGRRDSGSVIIQINHGGRKPDNVRLSPVTGSSWREKKLWKLEILKKIKKVLAFFEKIGYNIIRGCDTQRNIFGVSPNGKATDSDSVISRFESLYPSLKDSRNRVFLFS